jgi:hypothetical protein
VGRTSKPLRGFPAGYGSVRHTEYQLNQLLSKRFRELEEQISPVESTKSQTHYQSMGSSTNVDSDVLLQWSVKVKNLISKVGGENCEHYRAFVEAETSADWSGNFSMFKALKAVFFATKEDYLGGYLSSFKSIVQAEVFDTELEQARELLNNGYFTAAAVIAGVVLETTLRDLCAQSNIEPSNLNKMNADLAKAGVYNKLVQKQITAHAGIRNSAAHGNTSEFTIEDVTQMIVSVETFLAAHL